MKKICGSYDNGPCDDMTVPEFEHLVFIFPSSSVKCGNKYSWSPSCGVTESFTHGLEDLAEFLCDDADGFDGVCDGSSGVTGIAFIDDDSQVMIMGMSNGGGAATFGAVKYAKITGAVAVDYYGHGGGSSDQIATWLPANAGSPISFLKVYTACDSTFYFDDGFTSGSTTFAGTYGLSTAAAVAVAYPAGGSAPAWFVETAYTSADMAVYFARHGNSACDDTVICHAGKMEAESTLSHTCTGNQIHNWVNSYADWPNDVLEWVHDPTPPPSPPSGGGGSHGGGPTIFPGKPGKDIKKGAKSKKVLTKKTDIPAMALGPPPTKLGKFSTDLKPNKKLPTEKEFNEDQNLFKKPTLKYSFFSRGRF
jgi:hypothetical protein